MSVTVRSWQEVSDEAHLQRLARNVANRVGLTASIGTAGDAHRSPNQFTTF
ncbi:MAG TPA: hypothetical protein VFQ77_09490 [Pseudonocardiaceae bacterium]|nr:hypothetical protein [Pseudonocardiaceae bacterium]